MSGQAWGDYDHAGWQDLYVTGNLAPNALYRNNGDGTFSVSPLSKAVSLPRTISGGAIWADYDNDGWQDLYVLAMGANVLFRNEGGRGFHGSVGHGRGQRRGQGHVGHMGRL